MWCWRPWGGRRQSSPRSSGARVLPRGHGDSYWQHTARGARCHCNALSHARLAAGLALRRRIYGSDPPMDAGAITVKPLIFAMSSLEQASDWFRRLHNREPGLLKVVSDPERVRQRKTMSHNFSISLARWRSRRPAHRAAWGSTSPARWRRGGAKLLSPAAERVIATRSLKELAGLGIEARRWCSCAGAREHERLRSRSEGGGTARSISW